MSGMWRPAKSSLASEELADVGPNLLEPLDALEVGCPIHGPQMKHRLDVLGCCGPCLHVQSKGSAITRSAARLWRAMVVESRLRHARDGRMVSTD